MMTIRHVAGRPNGCAREGALSEEEKEYRELAEEFLRSLRGRVPFDLGLVLMENEKVGQLRVIGCLSDPPPSSRLHRSIWSWRVPRDALLRLHDEGLQNTPGIRLQLERFGVSHCSYQVMNVDGARSVLVLLCDRGEDRREERLRGHFSALCHQMADNLGFTIYRRREQRRMRHLKAVVEVSRIVAETYELPLLIERTLASINEHFNANLSCVLLYDHSDLANVESISMRVDGRLVNLDPDMRNRLLRRARERGLESLADGLDMSAGRGGAAAELPIVEVPIQVDGVTVGAIKCNMRDYLGVDELDMEFLNALANQLAAGVKNVLNYRRVEQRSETLARLNRAIKRLNEMLDGGEMTSYLARELGELAGAERSFFVPLDGGDGGRIAGRGAAEEAWAAFLEARLEPSSDAEWEPVVLGAGECGLLGEGEEAIVVPVGDGFSTYGAFVLVSAAEKGLRRGAVEEILPPLKESVVSALKRVGYYAEAVGERKKLEAVFDAMRDAVLVLDGDGRIAAANREAERLFGLDDPRARGRRLEEVVHFPGLADLARGPVGEGEIEESELVVPVDPPKPVMAYRAGVRLPGGENTGTVMVLRDVTHEKDLDRLKESFLSCVSHELNTPLAIIIGYSDILREGWEIHGDDMKRQYVECIKRSSERLHRVIADILSVSRISRGRLELDSRPCSLEEIARDMVDQYRVIDASHEYAFACRDAGCLCEADEVKIRRVVWNLVDNARKFSPPGSGIRVSVGRRGNGVYLSVRDEGIGISPWHLPSIFCKFSQVDEGDARKAPGLGIGLYLAKEIVNMHGGELEVQSEPDRGSTFTMVLPGLPEDYDMVDTGIIPAASGAR